MSRLRVVRIEPALEGSASPVMAVYRDAETLCECGGAHGQVHAQEIVRALSAYGSMASALGVVKSRLYAETSCGVGGVTAHFNDSEWDQIIDAAAQAEVEVSLD